MSVIRRRMSSFVDRGNSLIAAGERHDAMRMVERGMNFYSDRIVEAVYPYAKSDAGLLVLILRHIANEIEANNPGAKELAEGLGEIVKVQSMTEIEKVKRANQR